jgi:RHS repeat-associated protein
MVTRDRDTDANGTLDERLFALQDANWNTTALVNISGTVVERDTYSPFGVATYRDASGSVISTSAKDWVFLHQGGEKIAAGDYDFRNRIYSPTLGRWLSNDPIGFSAGDVNTYRYVGNGPTSLLDPMGLEDKKKWPWWWPKLIGSSNGSKAEDDEGGTYIDFKKVGDRFVKNPIQLKNPSSGGVILQHDIHESSVVGLDLFLDYAEARGLKLPRIDEIEEFRITKNCSL